jgi:hypothetical protein
MVKIDIKLKRKTFGIERRTDSSVFIGTAGTWTEAISHHSQRCRRRIPVLPTGTWGVPFEF